ncbi:NmrA family NAD(P)-binding protein [Catenulispora rubra]|uniref:NmrA family NAD(P)-binding protein n=1 Tax=Catenulispora rubra TaxID=280293 RepID=UPI0018927F2D|nr:NAD(P)H-binding protein [Catenulispora rubra]
MTVTVLVIGATGKSGRPVVEALAARGVKVAAASRNPENEGSDSNVIPIRFDWADRATWAPALQGAEALYIVGPYAQPDGDALVADLLAEAHDARRVVLLSVIGAELLPTEAMMAHWERAVRASGKEWTILHPNWFFQNFGTSFASVLRDRGVLQLPAGDGAVSFVDTRDIAEVAAVALTEDGHAGQILTITGPESLTHQQALDILGEAAGRTLTYRAVTPQQAEENSRAAGASERTIVAQRGLFQVIRDGGNAPVTDVVQRLTGRAPRSLARYAAEHADVWAVTAAATAAE